MAASGSRPSGTATIRTPSRACSTRARVADDSKKCGRAAGTASLLTASSRAAAFGDLDNDGGVDIVVVNRDHAPYVLRNVAPSRGQWVMFRVLEPNGRDSLGAEVTLSGGDSNDHANGASGLQLSGQQRPARAHRSRRGNQGRQRARPVAERHDRSVWRSCRPITSSRCNAARGETSSSPGRCTSHGNTETRRFCCWSSP